MNRRPSTASSVSWLKFSNKSRNLCSKNIEIHKYRMPSKFLFVLCSSRQSENICCIVNQFIHFPISFQSSKEKMTSYIMGIDVGTTSVKVCLINASTRETIHKNIKVRIIRSKSKKQGALAKFATKIKLLQLNFKVKL